MMLREFIEENELIGQRYDLAKDRILNIAQNKEDILSIYMKDTSKMWVNIFKFYDEIISPCYKDFKVDISESLEDSDVDLQENALEVINKNLCFDDYLSEFKKYNKIFYDDISGNSYNTSFANSEYVLNLLKDSNLSCDENSLKNLAFYLAWLSSEVRSAIFYAYENRKYYITIVAELFIQVCIEIESSIKENSESIDIDYLYNNLKDIAYWYAFDYADEFVANRIKEQTVPYASLGRRLFDITSFDKEEELYLFGEYITDAEIKLFNYIKSLSDSDIESIARTYVDGYYTGFVKAGKPIDKKKTVNIRYHIGMERVVKRAIELFKEKGLEPIIYRRGISVHTRNIYRIGYTGAVASAQYDYDHKDDKSIFYDKKYAHRLLEVTKNTQELLSEYGQTHAGPACIETFGEVPFTPKEKESIVHLSKDQETLSVENAAKLSQCVNEFIPGQERSFTIIAFPLPTIGDDFEEIFRETLKLNTLDAKKYEEIQSDIIDALDKGEYVKIKGMNGNKTDLTVSLAKLNNPKKETIFENCVADVNIPIGEVFTSPKLEGTNGILHVTSVYLNDLLYNDLSISFKEGMIDDYSCNDGNKDNGKKYIKDTLLRHRDTLPMGEFAIGTNTVAYMMARKYKIEDKMPILIAEKCGPHFAIGDTCYSHEEDVAVYNPNGKEIIARENTCSKKRIDNPQEAYFQCHTDITIPYDELKSLEIITSDKKTIPVIIDGRFVLDGTEELNKAFDA